MNIYPKVSFNVMVPKNPKPKPKHTQSLVDNVN